MKPRMVYAVLWMLNLIACFMPWTRWTTGWMVLFFHIITMGGLYVTGLIVGLIVLVTKRHAVELTIISGIFMIIGTLCIMIYLLMRSIAFNIPEKPEFGLFAAYIFAVVYTIIGTIMSKKI